MKRLAIIAMASLILAGLLCYSALVVAEAVAAATTPRIEVTQ